MTYVPRKQFMPLHTRSQRWSVIVAHRRAGKTVACINDLLTCGLATSKQNGRYGYIAPYYSQAKTVAWDYLKHYGQEVIASKNESETSVKLVNGSQIRLFGADNADAMRGGYFDGVVADEYGDWRGSVWGDVIRPMLADRKGWAVFIGTPKGRNQFYDTVQQADGDWLKLILKASETGILPQSELDDARKSMSEAQYLREFECAFDVPAEGAVYAQEMLGLQPRITRVPYDPLLKVHTAWDLGVGDSTAIWFIQVSGSEVRLIDYLEDSGRGLDYYVAQIEAKGYRYGKHIAPHDIQVREMTTGRTRIEMAEKMGIRFEVAPITKLEDGIQATRMLFPRLWVDGEKCKRGLECLQNYRRELNPRLGEFKPEPVHDWASHGADALRYGALMINQMTNQTFGMGVQAPKIKYPSLGIR